MLALVLTLHLFGPPSPPALHLAPALALAAELDLAPRVAGSIPPRAAPALDPHAGASRPGEWVAGALGVGAADLASALFLGAVLSGAGQNDEGFPRVSAGAAYGWLVFSALALPAGAALGAWLAANAEAGGSFGRAFGFALLAELVGVAACIPAFALNPWLGLVVVTGWQLGVIPWAASRGMHPGAQPESGPGASSAVGGESEPRIVALRF